MVTKGSKTIKGFKFSARAAGIKKSGKPDLALIYSEVPARCAGVFTTNKVVAAPVVVSAPRIRRGSCQAVLVNSGNANACTGEQGLRDALRCGELAAGALGLPEDLVAVSSTGVIGLPLPMDKFERHIGQLAGDLQAGAVEEAAEAIRTTDAFAKLSAAEGEADGKPYGVLAMAKGAGMIHPNMATMLAFVMTDACVEAGFLDQALRTAVDGSFNSITVDGDTSTNDMVLVLANGLAENPEIVAGTPAAEAFQGHLSRVLLELAKMIVRDGEGATKVVEIAVKGAAGAAQAKQAARSVATSSLVKTAFFGEDANWGRIIAAVGYSGADVDPNRVDIFFNEVQVVKDGLGTGKELEAKATEVLKTPEFTVTVDLKLGEGQGRYYTSDLTYDYVKINADYRS
ncbi:arginine biosynthesis bifunctional protein ArgJ [Desulfuromonas versatilis]|uniref:Arginine biosynthesis bifunctional protein ArgJ n=1 Tax=Desulfuromonas versatilis TaxID=2802975 RepID=A0ABN6DZ43_9BACT|nr:bifunctional glutamate N-acetyltransferase/amino-acid acetyltransferase ArgJ [Desulfuromonas versatilis]BCR04391.1 arginine biosynthesis bifunctional protein ArgJ [Desulfuromonas versatilis]